MENNDSMYIVVYISGDRYNPVTDVLYQSNNKNEAISVCADYAYAMCDKNTHFDNPFAQTAIRITKNNTTHVCSLGVRWGSGDGCRYEVREIANVTSRNRKQPWK